MPLDWNQLNQEDSSVSGYDSANDDNNDDMLPEPKILKMLSETATPKSLVGRQSAHDVVEQNLHKLASLDFSQVWLFVPKPYKNDPTDNVVSILKNHEHIKKVIPNSAGWNVLVTKKEQAKQLIVNSFKKDKLTLRFYVSTKNSQINHQNNRAKGSAQIFQENHPFDSPVKLRKLNHDEQQGKKKVKYQQKFTQKKSTSRQNSLEKLINQKPKEKLQKHESQNLQFEHKQIQLEEPPKILKIKQIKEKEVFQLKDTNLNLISVETEQILQKSESSENSQRKADIETNSPQNEGEEYDSEQSLERMKKTLKRKNKKLNKKKPGTKKTDSVDINNPFSMLT